ncbi:uncharacterized protein MELLADRAFT_90099 [Melampsora larici-populina 98AG31]|uniref:Uncharacterized protein n=1 Tax=Melampsora larici-populina (strain 98AG31 / pathotype 3-4-7) TaxID=747676 RepID=F4RVN3_MELLP|nr:uncharacterized protein MELLADRAFT_90099 [Melampsora larici-populina 98AG31]EGG03387.1 hypothetical protein MELLADRAFT_90099 [Melampsora larici-populina 98AG31]
MNQSTTQSTTRAKLASALGKLASKSRRTNAKAGPSNTEVEQEFKAGPWGMDEVDATPVLGYPMSSTLKVFNAQRSSKVPIREPAGFPINQNFSQRIIHQYSDEEANEAVFLTPYMRPSSAFPSMPLSPEEATDVPPQGSTSHQRVMPSFKLGRKIRELSNWRNSGKQVEVESKIPTEEVMPGIPEVPRVDLSSLGESPLRGEPTQNRRSKAWSPRTPFKSPGHLTSLITPGLSHSLVTPTTVENLPTPSSSADMIASEDETYFTSPISHEFVNFSYGPRYVVPPFGGMLDEHSYFPDQLESVLQPPPTDSTGPVRSTRHGQVRRPPGLEMMDTLDFLSQLCERPGVLAGDGESMLDRESLLDNDALMDPLHQSC